MSSNKERPWTTHPVVSTVLWLLAPRTHPPTDPPTTSNGTSSSANATAATATTTTTTAREDNYQQHMNAYFQAQESNVNTKNVSEQDPTIPTIGKLAFREVVRQSSDGTVGQQYGGTSTPSSPFGQFVAITPDAEVVLYQREQYQKREASTRSTRAN